MLNEVEEIFAGHCASPSDTGSSSGRRERRRHLVLGGGGVQYSVYCSSPRIIY